MEPGQAWGSERNMEPCPVLIVDDEEEMATTIAERLVLRGLAAEASSSPADALRRIAEHDYRVAIVDIKMPGMDGLQLMRKMRDIRPALRVILISGYGSPNERERGVAEGAFHCLIKPFDIEDLVALIGRATEG